ncbi:hypothetical protein BDQ94DRAFT_155580 [Aspergillus welwitschiae]|uniref:Uncharacterized protein n=1 Tax=Aspergillus welwitschiae TaxID=1341132 RepID=A0A3F3PHR1_9EURO|nr:hypothetical protein BDQ94DRAFT_155580 [Aspergillus welwitschiae]RDH26428.1 hypothetical protein BDQ94DRAFT_155580 [Aspergillus welwitschiae]
MSDLKNGLQMGFRAVLRYMFDVAKAGDEKAGSGEWQLTLKGKWTYGYGGDDLISLPCW